MCFARVIITNKRYRKNKKITYTQFITEGNIIREFENYQPTENQPPIIEWDTLSPGPTASEWFASSS
jgi:hypothetical protein